MDTSAAAMKRISRTLESKPGTLKMKDRTVGRIVGTMYSAARAQGLPGAGNIGVASA